MQRRELLPNISPDPSPDIVPALTFYSAAVAAVNAFASFELSEELRRSLLEEVSRPFLDRIMDAPSINLDGRNQYHFDTSLLLDIFSSGEGHDTPTMLRSALVILAMPDKDLIVLRSVIADVRRCDGENEDLEAASMLRAKGVTLDLDMAVYLMEKIIV